VLDGHENSKKKRTQRTESPDAFIQLNMQIVRVAHFSFITHVERQLCIVNFTLLLQSKSEEIEQIRFVQHSLCTMLITGLTAINGDRSCQKI
jgi:hypothetical protein